jgi:hypothetical protein
MTIKTLSAIAVVTVALASPVFAQDSDVSGSGIHRPTHAVRSFRGSFNQAGPPAYGWINDNYGWDRSRVGGRDPDVNPAAN